MIRNNVWHPERCNCLFWAYIMHLLTGRRGKVLFRYSKGWPGHFHVLWRSPDDNLTRSYEPLDPDTIGIWRSCKEVIFKGYVTVQPRPGITEWMRED